MRFGRSLRRVLLIMTTTALCASMVTFAPVAMAAGSYTGGAYDAPMFVSNDHTPFAIRFAATAGLKADQAYYVKVRFTLAPTPAGLTNRGFTWNESTGTWVQEREAWSNFPTVTTDGTGQLADTWVFAKIGDENVSGPYYILVSLSETGDGTTSNPIDPIQLMVLDSQTEASWIHNGVATGAQAKKRAEVTSESSTTIVYSLSRTEANLVDEDSDGITDNENWGPQGTKTGDYRFAVSAETTVDVYLNRAYAAPTIDDGMSGPPDTDVALGAIETTPPTAPTNLVATPGSNEIALEWDAATDNAGMGGYRVYRWEEPELTSPPYTPVKNLLGSTGDTTFTDDTALNGMTYHYEVRAFDDATNVGPRSGSASAMPAADGDTDRDWGRDRYATAIAASQKHFAASSVTTAVVATGKDSPDPLAASGLAGEYGSPVLLVGNTVSGALTTELDRLGVTDVIVVGGPNSVSDAVYKELDKKYTMDRVWGRDRYTCAAAVARRIAAVRGPVDRAFFVRGDVFSDAVAASPYSYAHGWPVLLVKTDSIPDATSKAITDLAIPNGTIAGGINSVSTKTQASLDGLLPGTLERVQGRDRYECAANLAVHANDRSWGSFSFVGVAGGTALADALGGGAVAGNEGGVLMLTKTKSLPDSTSKALTDNKVMIDDVVVFGGPNSVTAAVITAIQNALK